MRGLMQQGRASRAASPGCIVATSPQNEKGSASVSPGRPQFVVPCLGPLAVEFVISLLSDRLCLRQSGLGTT
jgi:hypothetical protein